MKEEGHRFLVVRKVAKTLRTSVFQLFRDYIIKWKLSGFFKINKTDMTITYIPNGNIIYFAGVDDPEKLKSIEGVTGIWIEEATELFLNDFEELDRRLRGVTKYYKQIILSYNPILKTNWTYKRFFQGISKEEKSIIRKLRTTYLDNRYILQDKAYIKLLRSYKGNMRKVYTLGEYGALENAIYTKWKTIPDKEFPVEDKADYGLDFGYINPCALVKMVVDMERKEIYVNELLYKTRLDTGKLAKELNILKLNDKRIIADSEAPDKINELKNWYYKEEKFDKALGKAVITYEENGLSYIEGALKGKGSVLAGIDYLQQFKIFITESSVNVIREIESYQRKKDKDGNILEEPEKGQDHSLDAIRMVMYTCYYNNSDPNFYVN